MNDHASSSWRAFLRHRYQTHVQGWLAIAVGLLWGYYLDLYWHEPLWAMLPATFIAAFFVVAVLVAVAALLRFPWWGLAPFCLISMGFEWALRRLLRRPWQRRPQPREWAMSNPFALWQGWRLKTRRKWTRRKWGSADGSEEKAARMVATIIPFPARSMSHRMRTRPERPGGSWEGMGKYIAEAFVGHWKVWLYSSPLWIGLWLWLGEGMDWLAALIASLILTFLFSISLVIPLLTALLALLSTLLFAAGMTPQKRLQAAATLRLARSAEVAAAAPAPQPAAPKSHWLWPLLIGPWIGHAWGDDD